MEIIFRDTSSPNCNSGATDIGEITMISTAPSIAKAIYNVCGVRITHLPATLDKTKESLVALNK